LKATRVAPVNAKPTIVTTCPISVINSVGTNRSASPFVVAPTIAGFSPTNGVAGTAVTILGTNFANLIAVRFGEVPAAFTNPSPSKIVATVPAEATTASINLINPAGIVATANLFLVNPNITGFAPSSGPVGAQISILGTGFGGVTGVSFGGVAASAFAVFSPTQMVATVPPRAFTGPITVTTVSGNATSTKAFVVGPAADLTVTVGESADPVLQNQVLTYLVLVTNQGPSTATTVVMTNSLPAGSFLLSATATPGSVVRSGQTLRAAIGNLLPGATAKLTINLLSPAAGVLTNVTSVSATEPDPEPADDLVVQTTTVVSNPAVLQIDDSIPGQVRVSWPVAATNFVLQSTAAIGHGATWLPVNIVPVVSGNQKIVTTPVGPGAKFFRLNRP
jgi:uncharacterized repeat protein (TIGR01451 family)